jgi:hypothetical protein
MILASLGLSGCIPYPVQETPHVSGTVIDAAMKRAIAGARVSFDKYQQQPALTDSRGRFDIPAISKVELMPLAPYDRFGEDRYLVIDAPGYKSLRVKANTWKGPLGETFALTRQ